MNNYVYIISSLPVMQQASCGEARTPSSPDMDEIVEEIRRECSRKDNAILDTLLEGFEAKNLSEEFYRKAASSACPFIREYFDFDRRLRNRKARYLNEELGRPLGEGCIRLSEEEEEDDAQMAARTDEILRTEDIVGKEKALDALVWETVDEMITFHYFDLDVILAFVVKMSIVTRWLRLDPQSGREMLRKLAEEVQGTFKGIEFNA